MYTVAKYLKSFHLETATALQVPRAEKNTIKLNACAIKKRIVFPSGQTTLASDDLDMPSRLWLRKSQNLQKAKRDGFVFISLTDRDTHSPDFCQVGIEAKLVKSLNLDDGEKGYLVRGVRRMFVSSLARREGDGYHSVVRPIENSARVSSRRILRQVSSIRASLSKLLKLNENIDNKTRALLLSSTEDPHRLCDLLAPHLTMTYEEQLPLLSLPQLTTRLALTSKYLQREVELLKYSSDIQKQVEEQITAGERANFVREQIKTLQGELADLDEHSAEVKSLTHALQSADLPPQVREVVFSELEKIDLAPYGSSEYMISHQYLSWLKDLPWHSKPFVLPDLAKAMRILDKNHFGLTAIKERILEHLAVIIHKRKIEGQILLFVGPPGVGKTSLVRSIADALQRKMVKISLGGMREEIEIRGLRRTYVGAMPGRIMQAIKQVGDSSAVILLDELDKLGNRDKHNDVQAALLEVLDYQQNKAFKDLYLDVPFDLSGILFVATANDSSTIPTPLLSRMEIVALSSYSDQEKIKIAQKHLLPQIRKKLHIAPRRFSFDKEALFTIIKNYTQEAGVRQLQRKIEDVGRKVIRQHVATQQDIPATLNAADIAQHLGTPLYHAEPNDLSLPPGVAIGLACTAFGGEIMYVETMQMTDKNGGLLLTGLPGKVMQESAAMARSVITALAEELGIATSCLENSRLHVHLPDGATPKDGPSAGLAVLLALTSLLTRRKLRASLAVSGEITLRGQVLPVGGIKEKMLAAFRYRKKEIILPRANVRDLLDVPDEVLRALSFHLVANMREALVCARLLPVARPVPAPQRLRKKDVLALVTAVR